MLRNSQILLLVVYAAFASFLAFQAYEEHSAESIFDQMLFYFSVQKNKKWRLTHGRPVCDLIDMLLWKGFAIETVATGS